MNSRLEIDYKEAVKWARGILDRKDVLILDSETTDLDGELVELAILNLQGIPLYNQRFNPRTAINAKAAAVHHLTKDMLADEPDFAEEYEKVKAILDRAGLIVVYNAGFDTKIIDNTCLARDLPLLHYNYDCAMLWYAQWVGNWNDYYGNYRWQKLPAGDHSALGDTYATLKIIQEMANRHE